MIRFCSVFFTVIFFAATAWAQPVNTYAIEGSQSILSQMTWLPDPQKTLDYPAASSAEAQGRYLPLTNGFGLQDTGPGWLRLELAKNDQQSSTAPTRVDKKSLYLNFNFLPSGKATLYKTGSFSSQPNARHKPLATKVYPFQIERLAEPSISNAVYYIQLEETPGLWFNPTLSRTDSKSPILPHDLLLPSILLACLAFSLLRLAIDRTVWPVWAAAILVCVITELLLSIPVSSKTLSYANLPVLMAPGIAVMIYAHLGRLLLYSPTTFPRADAFLKFYPIVGAVAALLPLVPQAYWVTRLFPLWGLLLLPLLVVATNALFRQLKGSFAYFVATFMPVLGACIALYGIFSPSIDMLAETGTFWGIAIGSFALIFARSAQPSQNQQEDGHKDEDVYAQLVQHDATDPESANEAGLDSAVAQNDKVAPLLIAPLAMGGEPNDIFTSLQYADLSGTLSTPEAFTTKTEEKDTPQGLLTPDEQRTETTSHGDALDPADNPPDKSDATHATQSEAPPEAQDSGKGQGPISPQELEAPEADAGVPHDIQAMVDELRLDTFQLGASPLPTETSDALHQSAKQVSSAQAQKTQTEDDDDILDLDTLAKPSFLSMSSPYTAQGKDSKKLRPSKKTKRQDASPLDWPTPEESASPAAQTTTASAPEPALSFDSPAGLPLGVPTDTPVENPAIGSPVAMKEAEPSASAQTDKARDIPPTSVEDDVADAPLLSVRTATDTENQTTALSAKAMPPLEMPQRSDKEILPSATVIRLTDESIDDDIPESATRKVDAVLASLDGFKAAPHKAASVISDDLNEPLPLALEEELPPNEALGSAAIGNTETEPEDFFTQEPLTVMRLTPQADLEEGDTQKSDINQVPAEVAQVGVTSVTESAAEGEDAVENEEIAPFSSTAPETSPSALEEEADSLPHVDNQTGSQAGNKAGEPVDETPSETPGYPMPDQPTTTPAEEQGADAPPPQATQDLSVPEEISAPEQGTNTQATNDQAAATLSQATQAVRERAYIEALLSTEDRPSSLTGEPAPLSPLIARYLQSHSEKEQEVLESYGGHCIVITEMTTSNRRLLQSYFNEIGIPCVEAKNIEDTTTIQAITGSPLIIYDADSPSDAIIQSVKQLNKAEKPPKHLVLTSVPSQGKQLLEQGATHAITKPFTKESLFTAAHSAAPQLFPHEVPVDSSVAKEAETSSASGPSASSTSQSPTGGSTPKHGTTAERHRSVNTTNLSSAEEAYIEELFGGHRKTSSPQIGASSGAEKINEQRVDDLLAQLNGEGGTPRSAPQTAEEQTASAISKMLSVDPRTNGQDPSHRDTPNTTPEPALADQTAPLAKNIEIKGPAPLVMAPTTAPSLQTKGVKFQTGKEQSAPKVKDSLLDFIVADDEGATVAFEATSSLKDIKTGSEADGMHPLVGIEGEYIEQLMLPLIPGLLYALKDGLTDAENALTENHIFGVQEAVSSIASKAETFGLKKLEKIAQCVVRAANANDPEATATLMEDMTNVTKRYIESLEQSYEAYIQGSRSTSGRP